MRSHSCSKVKPHGVAHHDMAVLESCLQLNRNRCTLHGPIYLSQYYLCDRREAKNEGRGRRTLNLSASEGELTRAIGSAEEV